MRRILIVEDEPDMLKGIQDNLRYEGYEVVTATEGKQAIELARRASPDLIILDIMLPEMDGFEVCRNLRSSMVNIPIIMLTAKSQEADRVVGLELGADDYVTKPFSLRELLARVKAVLRRTEQRGKEMETYAFGNVHLDFRNHTGSKKDKQIAFLPREFSIMKVLIENKGRVVSRDEIYDAVWGDEYFPDARPVDNQIAKIRKKIEDDPSNPKYIITVPKVGYKFIG